MITGKVNIRKLKYRLESIPQMVDEIIETKIKKDAMNLIKIFHDGIKENDLNLKPLRPKTIIQKAEMGFKRPITPLYGAGDDRKKNSYSNMLRMKKTKSGYKIYPSWGKHWKSQLKLRDLLGVHEYGRTINMPKRKLTVVLPPRPALHNTYQRHLEHRKADKFKAELNWAVRQLVVHNKKGYLQKLLAEQKRVPNLYGTERE